MAPEVGPLLLTFLSTPSARRATQIFPEGGDRMTISIHALREEGDFKNTLQSRLNDPFLSTPSARRATNSTTSTEGSSSISIHALREEGDR